MTKTERDDLAALRAFAQAVMECWPEGGVDGGYLEELAVEHGLLAATIVQGPCDDQCWCAEYYSTEDFKAGARCYRRSARLMEE